MSKQHIQWQENTHTHIYFRTNVGRHMYPELEQFLPLISFFSMIIQLQKRKEIMCSKEFTKESSNKGKKDYQQ